MTYLFLFVAQIIVSFGSVSVRWETPGEAPINLNCVTQTAPDTLLINNRVTIRLNNQTSGTIDIRGGCGLLPTVNENLDRLDGVQVSDTFNISFGHQHNSQWDRGTFETWQVTDGRFLPPPVKFLGEQNVDGYLEYLSNGTMPTWDSPQYPIVEDFKRCYGSPLESNCSGFSISVDYCLSLVGVDGLVPAERCVSGETVRVDPVVRVE